MSNAPKLESISVEEYLDGELRSELKYEYVDGRVYAMAGGTNIHNRIASRLLVSLGRQLGSSTCEALNSDTKIRVRLQQRSYFYYPDASIVCDSNPDDDTFQDHPIVIFEVVSESTRRVDEGEKCDHYLSIPSLRAYVLMEQDRSAARVYVRDADGEFSESVYLESDSVIPLESINAELRFADIY